MTTYIASCQDLPPDVFSKFSSRLSSKRESAQRGGRSWEKPWTMSKRPSQWSVEHSLRWSAQAWRAPPPRVRVRSASQCLLVEAWRSDNSGNLSEIHFPNLSSRRAPCKAAFVRLRGWKGRASVILALSARRRSGTLGEDLTSLQHRHAEPFQTMERRTRSNNR
jgi:hypothetical protein